ncbi:putative 15-hydroxyprostaglandin dehydrogenase (nad(+)) protein [Lasiodiplodia theobromae]|uniref:Indoleamine 2,3-dioxygenase n=1 Tax=Lasiodiplodia theobromae TaxID=45133 RepID=A0A8H7IQT0_9PEZI|nr:putative 15-hydroxyprostaglandin dehydrogenase (nad(+)) protein [Lasiodiplodia theobromae]
MAATFQQLFFSLLSYLKTLLLTFLTGAFISPKSSSTTTKKPITSPSSLDRHVPTSQTTQVDEPALLSRIASLADTHEAAARLHAMITDAGAGSWPPRFPTDISAWPAPLRAYHSVWQACAPFLAVPAPSTDDATNNALRASFRARMSTLLESEVDLSAVEQLLSRAESSSDPEAPVPRAVYNAFYACVAMSRHAFRWATIPAVRVGQEEKLIAYPTALTLPWPFLQRRYGFGSQAGNALSNFLYHWGGDAVGPVYEVNVGVSREDRPAVHRAEYWFSFMFAETERLALPVYVEIVEALAAWERGDRDAVLAGLKRMRESVRAVVRVLYDNLIEPKIEREVWLGWVQGFHAYGAGENSGVDGAYVEFDGVSGNQLPFFQVVDAFLGLASYLSPDESKTSIPAVQRRLGAEVSKWSFRKEVKERGDEEVEREMAAIAKQVRVWRAAHKVRIVPYLAQPAPERMLMMAGKSVLETKGVKTIKGVVEYLDYLVGRRIEQTA